MRALSLVLLTFTVAVAAAPVRAATCNVPSVPYPSIVAAVANVGCTTVLVAAGAYPGDVKMSRDVTIQGAGSGSTTVAGAFLASGATTHVAVSALRVDGGSGCHASLFVSEGGARLIAGPDVDVRWNGGSSPSCFLFADGFESGNLLGWSEGAPH